jgi:hypothetical protein
MRRNTKDGGPSTAPGVVLDAVLAAAAAETAVMQERADDADAALVVAEAAAARAHASVGEAVEAEADARTDAETAEAEAEVGWPAGNSPARHRPRSAAERRLQQARRVLQAATQAAETVANGLTEEEFATSEAMAVCIAAMTAAEIEVALSEAAQEAATLTRARQRRGR